MTGPRAARVRAPAVRRAAGAPAVRRAAGAFSVEAGWFLVAARLAALALAFTASASRSAVAAVAAVAAAAAADEGPAATATAASFGPPPPVPCRPGATAQELPGVIDPFHVPPAEAKRLNAEALGAYRKGLWDEARGKYRAAEAADPEFLAPALNVACSFVRQERFSDAFVEVRRLLRRAFLPWSDEILTAADLGALKVGARGQALRALLDEERRRWAAGLPDDVFFVARTRAPLKLTVADGPEAAPSAPRVLVLGPRQEVFAWSPRTARYRQITAEQGRVLALGVSRDRRRVAYVTAEKLVVAPGAEPALRGVVVKELALGTLALEAAAHVAGDVRRLEVFESPRGFAYRLDDGSGGAGTALTINDGRFEPAALPKNATRACRLTGKGIASSAEPVPLPDGCEGTARDARGAAGAPGVEVLRSGGRRVAGTPASGPSFISGPFGGGLHGLPVP